MTNHDSGQVGSGLMTAESVETDRLWDLTTRLLARLDADQAVAEDVARERKRVGEIIGYPAEEPDYSFFADYDGGGPAVSVGADRVLAQIAAIRAVVEIAGPALRDDGTPLPGSGVPDILRALARPYVKETE